MKVIVAEVLGMCFGVRDALHVIAQVPRPEVTTIHGELVHNEKVLESLRDRGFLMIAEAPQRPLPSTDTVLITAHGISEKERQRLRQAGKYLVDTTCPLVVRAHQAAQKLQREGYHVLLIGRRGHVEVQGIIEDLAHCTVIEHAEEVTAYPNRRLGIMCQTTAPERLVRAVRDAVAAHNPQADICFIDTVCHPTKDHQKALDDLLDQVEAMVVVGGHNSNNTRQLVVRCEERGIPAFHVQTVADLQPGWFGQVETVGLTAGTSTLEETIQEVHRALLKMGQPRTLRERPSRLPSLANH